MASEIKKRIDQIKRGEVPRGYKRTSVGIAPTEWEETCLSNIFSFKNGLNKEKEAFGKGTPIVNYTDIYKHRGLRVEDIKGKVELSAKEIENFNVKKGDVFFTRTSETVEEIGMSSVILEDVENTVFSGFILRARPLNNKIFHLYNQYCYSSDYMRNEVKKKSSLTTRALTNGNLLGQVAINLPTYKEQQKIATILSTWDKAVYLQEKLLEKLEVQKKALMQKLLTPKAGWTEVKLGDICTITTGKLDVNAMDDNGKYPFFTCAKEKYCINTFAFDTEAILVSGNGANVGYVHYYYGKFNAYQRTYVLSGFTENILLIKLILDKYLNQRIENEKRDGNTPYIVLGTLMQMKIYLPKSNQDMVVHYLTSSENIEQLQTQKLEKLKEHQKAIRQLLLTGIVRVN